MSKEQTISARFKSATAAEIDMIAESYGTTASKWIKGKVEEALQAEKQKVKAALSAAASGQSNGSGGLPLAVPLRSEQQLPGRGDILLEQDGTPGPRFFEAVETSVKQPPAPTASASTTVQPAADGPASIAPSIPPAWKSTPKPGPKPSWTRPPVAPPPEPDKPAPKFECDVCEDEGGPGILVECGSCGRFKDQQGKVNESPDGPPVPQNWETAWSVMEQMGNLERQERFAVLSGGRSLPDNWRALAKVEKIRWLNENWPLS